jgi:preprotein translocase subunit YajC
LANLQKGDKVVTIAGIHGTINRMNDDGTFQLEINPGSYIKMEKTAISMEMSAKLNAVQTAAPIK